MPNNQTENSKNDNDLISNEDFWRIFSDVHKSLTDCDQKIYFFMAFFGLGMTFFLTNGKVLSLYKSVTSKIIDTQLFGDLFYLLVLTGSLAVYILGLIFLYLAFKVRLSHPVNQKEKLGNDSLIYFGAIAEMESCSDYKSRLCNMNNENFRNNMSMLIYEDANIVTDKYSFLMKGMRLVIIGFCSFALLIAIGNFIYPSEPSVKDTPQTNLPDNSEKCCENACWINLQSNEMTEE